MTATEVSLVHVNQDLVFNLSNGNISYIFQVSPEGIAEHIYFGAYVSPDNGLSAGPRREFRCAVTEFQGIKNYCLDDTPQEYPLYGTSDTRHPALHLLNAHGNTTNTLLYHSHEISKSKPEITGLPSASGGKSETLVLRLSDSISNVQVELLYTVYQDHDVIARSAKVINKGSEPQQLLTVLSSSIDLPQADYELLHFTGSWSREFEQQTMAVPAGRFVIESTRGTSSNVHNPFVALMSKGANETTGEVLGSALMYSGNFAINIEQNEFESVRLSCGINPFNFRWQLNSGESFSTPEALHVFSDQGLEGMSKIWHNFIRDKISPITHSSIPRPTYLNSWEAAYFDVNHDLVMELADQAKALGVEMLVLDDGWFIGRHDDTTSLGDWHADPQKFALGIEETAKQVRQKGLKFGLWFEPEMVNQKSALYQQHPEWLIQVPGRTISTGRYQHILDLTRAEVVEYLFERLDSFLSSGFIDYIKWDMNRVMTEIGSLHLIAERQLEVPHRYMLGLYSLVERITQKYPDVLFENCASGGNRFDLGMLRYMSQGWVSDMCDPVGRLSIINGATHLFPLSTLASYIGPVPNHQNGRVTSLKMRKEVGFFAAARGLSLNQADLLEDEQAIRDAISLYRETAEDMLHGDFKRLKYTPREVCWQLSSADQARIYVGYYHILSAPNLPYRRVKLRGLEPAGVYQDERTGNRYGGDSLMRLGIDLPYVDAMQHQLDTDYGNHLEKGDFSSNLMFFKRVS